MAFQIVEITVDADDNPVDRKVVPYPFATRTEAVTQIENVIAGYAHFGHEPKHTYWWVTAANGDRMRFVIEVV